MELALTRSGAFPEIETRHSEVSVYVTGTLHMHMHMHVRMHMHMFKNCPWGPYKESTDFENENGVHIWFEVRGGGNIIYA